MKAKAASRTGSGDGAVYSRNREIFCGGRTIQATTADNELEHFPTMLNRHCERSEAIQELAQAPGLLRRPFGAPRNDAADAVRSGNALIALSSEFAGDLEGVENRLGAAAAMFWRDAVADQACNN